MKMRRGGTPSEERPDEKQFFEHVQWGGKPGFMIPKGMRKINFPVGTDYFASEWRRLFGFNKKRDRIFPQKDVADIITQAESNIHEIEKLENMGRITEGKLGDRISEIIMHNFTNLRHLRIRLNYISSLVERYTKGSGRTLYSEAVTDLKERVDELLTDTKQIQRDFEKYDD